MLHSKNELSCALFAVGRQDVLLPSVPLLSLGSDQTGGNLEHPVLTISSLGWCLDLPPSGIKHFLVAAD